MNFGKLTRASIVFILIAVILSGCGGAASRKAKYLERAKNYLAEENYDKATVEFKNVLQIDPKDAEAYYLLGTIDEKRQEFNKAFANYSKAIELNPKHMEARARLGHIYLLAGDTDKATEMADAMLSQQPGNIQGKSLKIGIQARKGDVKGAIPKAEELLAQNPTSTDAIDLLASLYLSQNELDKAAEVLNKGMDLSPKNIPFRATLAGIYLKKNEFDKAEKVLEEIIQIEPDKLQHRALLASVYSKSNELDKAEKTLRDAIQAKPRDVDRYLLLADFLAVKRGTAQAEQELLSAIKKYPDEQKLRFGLAKLYERTGSADKAEATYKEIIATSESDRDTLRAKNDLANSLFNRGQREESARLVAEVLKSNPTDSGALILKGKLSLVHGDAQGAIESFRTVLKDQPNSVGILTLLADAYMMNKTPELARENLLKAAQSNPQDPDARIALAKYYVRMGDYAEALKNADEALKISPNNFSALETKLEILAAKRDEKGAKAVLMKIKSAYPERPVGYLQLGQFYLSQKKYNEAIDEFELALKKSPNTLQALTGIVNAYVIQGKPERAVNRLNEALKESPNHPFAHELLAEVYVHQKEYDKAESELRQAIASAPKWIVPYTTLASVYLVRGEPSKAEETYKQGLQAIPDDPQLLFQLAQLHERAHDYSKAIEGYERILEKHPDFEAAINNLASLLADTKGDAESLKRAKTLAARFESSPQPAFRDTLGWVYYKSGETDKALAILKDVVKQAPNIAIFQYHLGMAYNKQGNSAEAKTHLAKAVNSKADFFGKDEAKAVLAQLH